VNPRSAFKALLQNRLRHAWLGIVLALASLALGLHCSRTSSADEHGLLPTISEFSASNRSILADEEGDYPDWIEVHNREAVPIDLGGWYLTDNDNDLTKWRLPPTKLDADGRLVVFASGKDRALAGGELHTNFRLDSEGEYLALVQPDGRTVAWEYAPRDSAWGRDTFYSRIGSLIRRQRIAVDYRPQFRDISYGLDAALHQRYYLVPTPGRANGSDTADQGPIVYEVRHTPTFPTEDDAIVVNTLVEASTAPIGAVTLYYRIMYGDTVSTAMFDDGAHDDGDAGDGIYGAAIPGSAHKAGEMVRYYVTATDQANHSSRWPLFADPLDSPRYLGTMITDPAVESASAITKT